MHQRHYCRTALLAAVTAYWVQPVVAQTCYTSLTQLDEDEKAATDLDVVRTYILCPDTTFETGFLNQDDEIIGGDLPLTLRQNMHVKCGDDGSSANNCVVTTGTFGLTALEANWDDPEVASNVILQGVTFDSLLDVAVLVAIAGDFQFIDCIFQNHLALEGALVLEWDGGIVEPLDDDERSLQSSKSIYDRYRMSPEERQRRKPIAPKKDIGLRKLQDEIKTVLTIEFKNCIFKDNACAPKARPGIVNIRGIGVDIAFTDCSFENNDAAVAGVNDARSYGYIIENGEDAPLKFERTCFTNNKAYGNSLVTVYGQLPTLKDNWGSGNAITWTFEKECEFVAKVADKRPFDSVECANFDASSCLIEPYVAASPAPTPIPTAAPTTVPPTPAPTVSPTPAPSTRPTVSPTKAPTKAPQAAPTDAPTKKPTQTPQAAPTDPPTVTPTPPPQPDPTSAPVVAPTSPPASNPTATATATPTIKPATAPTRAPTRAPTPEDNIFATPPPSANDDDDDNRGITFPPTGDGERTAPTPAPGDGETLAPTEDLGETNVPTVASNRDDNTTAGFNQPSTPSPAEAPVFYSYTQVPTMTRVPTTSPSPTVSPTNSMEPTQSEAPSSSPEPIGEPTVTQVPTVTQIPTTSPAPSVTGVPTLDSSDETRKRDTPVPQNVTTSEPVPTVQDEAPVVAPRPNAPTPASEQQAAPESAAVSTSNVPPFMMALAMVLTTFIAWK